MCDGNILHAIGVDVNNRTSLKSNCKDEKLVPSYASSDRKSNIIVATFNLVATIVGGGVLSLPLSFEKAGIIPATIMMIIAAAATDFTLYILCCSSRRTGSKSYGEVCLTAFGRGFEVFTTFLLFLFLMFVIVAYMVLIRDIWTPVILSLVSNSSEVKQSQGNIVLFGLVGLMSPFLIRKDLHALRFNCYIGFASITILCTAIVYRAYQKCQNTNIDTDNDHNGYINDPIVWVTSNFWDGLYVFPIIMLSFFCAFNIIPVQSALIKPSRTRVQYVIHTSVGCCFLLMYTFGLAGYLFARSETKGNILSNFDVGDQLIIIGRIGSGLTILMNMPLIILPCRQSILEFIPNIMQWMKANDKVYQDLEQVNESSMLVSKNSDSNLPTPSLDISKIPGFDIHALDLSDNRLIHLTSTFLIAIVCYVFAVTAPGVAIVWSICGSSMAFLIGFIIPCACYIKIRQFHADVDWYYSKIMFAWVILVIATIAAIACTTQSIWEIMHMN